MKTLIRRIIPLLILTMVLGFTSCGKESQPKTEEPTLMIPSPPDKIEASSKYTYEYMGLSYTLPDKLTNMLKDGRVWMNNDSSINEDNSVNYSFMFFNLIPKDKVNPKLKSLNEYNDWLKLSTRIGGIGVFNAEYLKKNPIDKLTGCKTNKEIGKSSNGKFVFYFSTNSVTEDNVESLLKEAKITIKDPVPAPEGIEYFNILGQTRPNITELKGFEANSLSGKKITSEIFKDYDLTMVNVWTTTCSYCIEEMPYLEEIRNEMQKSGVKFNIVGVCLDINKGGKLDERKVAKANKIIEKTGVTYENLIPDDVLWKGRMKGIDAFPETFFVDKNGKIVGDTHLGAKDKNKWLATIKRELKAIGK